LPHVYQTTRTTWNNINNNFFCLTPSRQDFGFEDKKDKKDNNLYGIRTVETQNLSKPNTMMLASMVEVPPNLSKILRLYIVRGDIGIRTPGGVRMPYKKIVFIVFLVF
jgi:hypothetical protein